MSSAYVTRILLKMPDIDLGHKDARLLLREHRERVDMMRWYLYAETVQALFEQWPQLESISVENEGEIADPVPAFAEEDWAKGADEYGSREEQQRLQDDFQELGHKTFLIGSDGLVPSLKEMCDRGTLRADNLMDTFGQLWASTRQDPKQARAQWEELIAQLQGARLGQSVDAVKSDAPKPPPRM